MALYGFFLPAELVSSIKSAVYRCQQLQKDITRLRVPVNDVEEVDTSFLVRLQAQLAVAAVMCCARDSDRPCNAMQSWCRRTSTRNCRRRRGQLTPMYAPTFCHRDSHVTQVFIAISIPC